MKIEIYQIEDTLDNASVIFRPSERVKSEEGRLPSRLYQKVYEFESTAPMGCEDVFVIFNLDRPADYSGRSVSTSDVVALDGVPFFCEPVGWTIVEWEAGNNA